MSPLELLVPQSWRHAVFDSLHGLSHPGIRATQRLIAASYVWPQMNSDVCRWARSCLHCQRSKIHRHTRTPLTPFPVPDARFSTVHIDLVGPLPPSRDHTYLLTCVDRFTRWPEAFPIQSITAEAVAKAFLMGWVSRFGVPSTIVTDRGRQFESTLWRDLMQFLGSKRVRTTSFHPQTNGMVERFHRQLKAALKIHPNSWMDTLPLVMLGIRSAVKEDMHLTSAEMVYGATLRIPGMFFTTPSDPLPDPTEYVSKLKTFTQQLRPSAPRIPATTSYVDKNLADCTHVFIRCDTVRKPLQTPYDGPYPVIKRENKYFVVDIKGRRDTVSLDRLKPAYMEHIDSTANAPAHTPQQQQSTTVVTPDPPPQSTRKTRSGRRVHWPVRLYSYVS